MTERERKATSNAPIGESGELVYNPFSEMLMRFSPRKFVGREDLLARIIQAVSSERPMSFSIYGARKIGKTTLLKHLCQREGIQVKYSKYVMNQSFTQNNISFVYVDIPKDRFEEGVSRAMLVPMCESLSNSQEFKEATNAGETLKNVSNLQQAKDALKKTLGRAASKKRLVLCIDHFDSPFLRLTEEEDAFLYTLTNYSSFILATEKPLEELKQTRLTSSILSGRSDAVRLGAFSLSEANALMRISGEEYFKESESEFLLEVSGRHPFLLTLACDFFISYRAHFPEVSDHISDPNVKEQVKLEMESRYAVKELFKYMWAQLSDDEREILFNIASGKVIDEFETHRSLFKSLRQQSLIYEDFKTGTYRVFSDLFRDYVRHQWAARTRRDLDASLLGLTGVDKKLFNYLKRHPNEEIPTETLYKEVWRKDAYSKRAVEAAIHRLRGSFQAMSNRNWDIENVRSVGYRYILKSVSERSQGK